MSVRREPGYVPFVDLSAQHRDIAIDLERAIAAVIARTDFILGEDVSRFEAEFAEACGVAHGIGVDSGTSALDLALRAVGVGPGDEVVTAANSFVASAFAVSHTGATPVLADVDPETLTLDPGSLERAITRRTKAVVPVHLYGHPADMDPIIDLAWRHGLRVVEDACQAHGARYKGRPVGSLGDAAAFSFYPGKNLGACGDGGMVVTRDDTIAARLKLLRNYGQLQKYHHVEVGYNRRLDSMQAAILRVKLRHLERWNDARRAHAGRYRERLRACGLDLQQPASWVEPVWHLFVVGTDRRDPLAAHLARQGISTGIHYPVPIHLQPAYRRLRHRAGDFPVTERWATRLLSLPMYPELTDGQIDRVAATIAAFGRLDSAVSPDSRPAA